MAIFNAPLPQADHALRAMQAALALQDNQAAYHEDLPPDLRMQFGVGIATGDALVGNIGAMELLHYTAVGDTVNLAQRLEEMAVGGEILITESCFRAVAAGVQVQARGATVVRGRSDPVSIFSLVSLAGEAGQGKDGTKL
jgi:class 3 adenylate cyclase